jgi:hypothetical protein
MARTKKPVAPALPVSMPTGSNGEALIESLEAGLGAPQEILPQAARVDVAVYPPKMTPVARMVPTDWNTNEQSADTFQELVHDIQEHGFSGAVDVVPFTDEKDGLESYLVVSGEWRWRAAKMLGIPEIPASHLVHQKFSQRDFQMVLSIRRNTIKGKHQKDKLRAAVLALTVKYPDSEELRRMLAFTKADEWKRLVGQTRDGLQQQGMSKEMMAAFDEKAKHARSLGDLSNIVSRLYDLYKDTVPFGFMVFTYGKQEHFYIAATKGTMRGLKRILDHCKSKGIEVNSVLGPAFDETADKVTALVLGPVAAPLQDGPPVAGLDDGGEAAELDELF